MPPVTPTAPSSRPGGRRGRRGRPEGRAAQAFLVAGGALGVVVWGLAMGAVGLLVVGTLVLAAPLVGMLAGTVVALGLALAARRAGRVDPDRRRAWRIAAVVALLAPAHLVAAVLGAVVPDALDALPPDQRVAVAEPISAHRECHAAWPATRVTRLRVTPDGRDIEFTCAWSILGWPRFDGWASCAGDWFVSGRAAAYGEPCEPVGR